MAELHLKIEDLNLDHENPRITKAESQRETLRKIIEDQDLKLVALAESIVDDGLNPMDRFLVIKARDGDGKYTVLEGNRRTAALKTLINPAVLSGLEIRPAIQKRFETLAQSFDRSSVEPIPCYEMQDRAEGTMWIQQWHTGENEGRGIVDWSGIARSRFRGRDPALQALDFVRQHADLTEDQKILLEGRFPITTLDRLLSTPDVRSKIGLDIKDDKLLTSLPPHETVKPLKRIILDLAEKRINVTKLKSKDQQVDYVSKLDPKDMPDLSKKGVFRPIEEIEDVDFTKNIVSQKRIRKARQGERRTVVPRNCRLNITKSKIHEVYKELSSLRISEFPHAISVLLRVFLETSVDHLLEENGVPLKAPTKGGGDKEKSLQRKVEEAVNILVSKGANRRDFDGVVRALSIRESPLSVDLLHAYVHNRFVSPTERDLTVAWDNAQPFFERIWP